MKTRHVVAVSMLSGMALGITAIEALRAQVTPPAYVIAEIDVSEPDGYAKQFAPLAVKATTALGGKFLARGSKTVSIDGTPPSSRVILMAFDNLETAQATFASPAFRDAKTIGDSYAKFRIWAVEGLAQ